MSIVNKDRQALERGKMSSRFEDALKAKAKLNLFEKRQDMVQAIQVLLEGVDVPAESAEFLKMQFLATQGLGEIGDKARPSKKSLQGLQRLYGKMLLSEEKYGVSHRLTRGLKVMVFQALCGLLNRSVRREHTNVEVVMPPPEMFNPMWSSMGGAPQKQGLQG